MVSHRRIIGFILLLALPALACNAFAETTTEPALTPPPTLVGDSFFTPAATILPENGATSEVAATATLPGEAKATPAAGTTSGVATPDVPTVTVLVDLNIRTGPGVEYDRVGFLLKGARATILGKDPAAAWWKIQCPAAVSAPECWVSGGEQYSQAGNVAGVPVAVVPPTPTPVPVALPDNTGLLVYVDNGRLLAILLDLRQNPPTAGDPIQLDDSPDVQQVAVSPDGRSVAYIVNRVDGNELRIVNSDGRNARVLVDAADMPFVLSATELPDVGAEGDPNLSVHLFAMQWLADSQTIAFNTGIINSAGFSPGSHSDLWTVTLAGALTERFTAGTAGPIFTISAQNQVLFSRSDALIRANIDGSGRETALEFNRINLAEAFYYPRPQWIQDGSLAYVAISDQLLASGALAEDPTATVWQIPTSGVAEKLGGIFANVVNDPPVWSNNGRRLAYVRRSAGQPLPEIVLADAGGQGGQLFLNDSRLQLLGWSEDNEHFLYEGSGFYAAGRLGESSNPFKLVNEQGVANGRWLNRSTFLVVIGTPGSTAKEVRLHNLDGDSRLVTTLGANVPQFDSWLP